MGSALVSTALADWNFAIEEALMADEPAQAVALAQVVLKKLPRHLPTYQRLLRVAWALNHWAEGADWGQRLLRADPGNALAWQAVAMATEQRGQRAAARTIWQRAFEADPYAPDVRAGLDRTTLRDTANPSSAHPLAFNLAALASLALRGHHWARAAQLYRGLIEADARRIDFQLGLLAALWQQRAMAESHQLACYLVQKHPYLLIAWVARAATGDENDRALARDPIATMDPDGDFVRTWFGLHYAGAAITLSVSEREGELLTTFLQK